LDNPTSEPTPLTTESAAALFLNMGQPEADIERKPEPVEETAEAEEPKADADAEETVEEDEPTFTVKIDGKDVEVPLSELKNGYSRQSDATRKTQAAAEMRKAAEAETHKAQQERQTYAQNLQRLQVQTETMLQQQQGIDWAALLESDPVEYLKQQRIATEQQARLNHIYGEQQRVQQVEQHEAQQRQAIHLQDQREQLLAKIPAWKDEAKAKTEKAELRDYLLGKGVQPEYVDNLSEAVFVDIAYEAMQFRKMVAKAAVAAKKVSTLPTRVERPGVGESQALDKRSTAFQKLSKSGRAEDAAAVFASLL